MNTAEAARELNISTATLVRWIKHGKVAEVAKDRNGRRVFTQDDIEQIRTFRDKLVPAR